MSDGDGGDNSTLRGLIVSLVGALAVLLPPLLISTVLEIGERREQIQQTTQGQCADTSNCGPESLHASIRAAVAAEDMVDLAIWQVVLGLFGLVGVGLTVLFAAFAWREAQRSANVAHETLVDARRAFEADNRTWVTIEPTGLHPVTFSEGATTVCVTLKLTNVGEAPALHVQAAMKAYVSDRFIVNSVERDEIVAFQEWLAGALPDQGVTLIGGQWHEPQWSSIANRISPDTRPSIQVPAHARPPALTTISLVYCVFYKSAGSDLWRHTAAGAWLSKLDGTGFEPELGNVPADQLRIVVIPELTQMT